MADVAFLLIIFFMLTAVYASTRGLLFGYPKDEKSEVQPLESIHIHVRGEGQIFVDRRPATLEQLYGYVQTKLSVAPDKPVIIETDPHVPYFAMIDVLDVLKKLNVKNVSIPTQAEIQRWGAMWIR